jgi:hypothetical protein
MLLGLSLQADEVASRSYNSNVEGECLDNDIREGAIFRDL